MTETLNTQPRPLTIPSLDSFYVAYPHRWLVVILLLYVIVATRFALLTPDWEAPDEPAHYNYIAYVATQHALPVLHMGDYDQELMELLTSSNFDPSISIAPVRYEDYQPPLYYLTATPVFWLSGGQLRWLRLYNVLLGVGMLCALYGCFALVFPTKPLINLGAVAFAGALPMHVAVTAALNNDVLTELLILLAFYLLLVWARHRFYTAKAVVNHAHERRLLLGLGVVIGLGLETKIYAYILLPLVLFAICVISWRNQRTLRSVMEGVRTALWALVPALVLGLPLWVRNIWLYGAWDWLGLAHHDRVVVGQPRTMAWIADYGWVAYTERAFNFTFRSFWGVFGWLGVFLDDRLYTAFLLFTGVLFLGLLWASVRLISGSPDRDMDDFQLWVLGLFGIILVLDLATYVWYNLKFVQHQGRYFFWGILAISAIVALGWREVMQPLQGAITGFLAFVLAIPLGLTGFVSGSLNKWTLLTLLLIALFLLLQPLLLMGNDLTTRWPPAWLRNRMGQAWLTHLFALLRFCAWATPFALLFLLDFLIPTLYIIPQLNGS